MVPRLKKSADIVIALSHLGHDGSGSGTSDVELARAVPQLDVIVGGHTHSALKQADVVGKTLIVQAGSYSEYVVRLDLTVDSAMGIVSHQFELIPVNMKRQVRFNGKKYYMYTHAGYLEDNTILTAMAPFIKKADKLLSRPVGTTSVELTGSRNQSRQQETNLGNLITDAMRAKTGADIAFQNGGGIRAGISPGTITYRDILMVLPFGNTLVLLDMTGRQILEVLDHSAAQIGEGPFMQVSGISFAIKDGMVKNVKTGNKALKPGKTYKVVTNSFVAAGLDGYQMFKSISGLDTGFVDADTLKEYIAGQSTVSPKTQERIIIK